MKNKTMPVVRIAAVQAEPQFLQLEACIDKCADLIRQAGKNHCDLIAFPETYIPGYPDWLEFYVLGEDGRQFDKELYFNSISLDSEYMKRLQYTCKEFAINCVLSINETEPGVIGTMYNSHVYIDRDGIIVGKHQKYVPTVGERQSQAPGKTGYFNTFDTNFGVVSSLICGENSNPLGIYAAATRYPVIHVASWPSHFGLNLDMHRIIRMVSSANAYTLKSFVINSVTRISERYIELMSKNNTIREFLYQERKRMMGATVYSPDGTMIACGDGNSHDLLFCDIDTSDVVIPHIFQDFAGHYQRPDIFAPLFSEYFENKYKN